MSNLTQKEKADKVTVEYVLAQFYDITQSEEPWTMKLKVLNKMGDFLKMFEQHRKVEIDIKSVVSQIRDSDLASLSGVTNEQVKKELQKELSLGMFDVAGNRIEGK